MSKIKTVSGNGPSEAQPVTPLEYYVPKNWKWGEDGDEDPPENAADIVYLYQVKERLPAEYAAFGITADDPEAPYKLIRKLFAELKPKIYADPEPPKPTDGVSKNIEAWGRVRSVMLDHLVRTGQSLKQRDAAAIVHQNYPGVYGADAEAVRTAVNRGKNWIAQHSIEHISGYSDADLVVATELEMRNALHSLDDIADWDDCISFVLPGSPQKNAPFAVNLAKRLIRSGGNVTFPTALSDEILSRIRAEVAAAKAEMLSGLPKHPGGFLIVSRDEPQAERFSQRLAGVGAYSKIIVDSALFGLLQEADRPGGNSPEMYFVCLDQYVPKRLLRFSDPSAPKAELRDSSYRARETERVRLLEAEAMRVAQEKEAAATPYVGEIRGILGGAFGGTYPALSHGAE